MIISYVHHVLQHLPLFVVAIGFSLSTSTRVLKQCKKSLCRVSPGRNEDSTVGRFLMFYFFNQHSMTQLVLSLTGKVSKMYLIVSAKFKTSLSARAQDGMKGEFWRLGKSIGMGKG